MSVLRATVSTRLRTPETRKGPAPPTRQLRDRSVQFYGALHDASSLANVGTQVALQIAAALPETGIHSYTGPPAFNPELARWAGHDPDAPVGIFWGVPDAVPHTFLQHRTCIGGFVCETDRIPVRWTRRCNLLDLVVVPSRYCYEAFHASGVTSPIAIVHHGLEPAYVPGPAITPDAPVVFYEVADSASPHRKGTRELIRGFGRAFAHRADVVLRLRTRRTADLDRWIGESGLRDRVEIRSDPLPTGEFAASYSQAHWTVHPARSEGFGLVPFQSIACGTPVIAARSTGMVEYLEDDHGLILEPHGLAEETDVYYATGRYPDLDEDHLVELLRIAADSGEEYRARLRSVAPGFRARFSWSRVLQGLVDLVGDLPSLGEVDERRQRILDFCTTTERSRRPGGSTPCGEPTDPTESR